MWRAEWQALSARINGLLEAASYYFASGGDGFPDHVGVDKFLIRGAAEIFEDLRRLHLSAGRLLPPRAGESLARFINDYPKSVAQTGRQAPRSTVTALAAFRSEFAYLITDSETRGRSLVKRGFAHLKRSLVADQELRTKWLKALRRGETACEKLGAVHLLSHGVWAFKASADGGRTDLILGGSLAIDEEVRASAESLVLTEWKVVRSSSELEEKAALAFAQARRYSEDTLAGFELSSTRYLVLVSAEEYPMPPEQNTAELVYEYVGIAVNRPVPSRSRG